MKSTITIAGNLGINPFSIFDNDCDEVIMLINFYLTIGEEKKENAPPAVFANDREESAAFWAAM